MFINKIFVEICFFCCYISTELIFFILPLGLQSLKYLPSAPLHVMFADLLSGNKTGGTLPEWNSLTPLRCHSSWNLKMQSTDEASSETCFCCTTWTHMHISRTLWFWLKHRLILYIEVNELVSKFSFHKHPFFVFYIY